MRRLGGLLVVWSCCVAAAGCEDAAEPFVPPSFDRADQVTLACVDVLRSEGVPVAECEVEEPAPDLHLYALVTQSQRGELAVVDLTADTLLDVNPQVPGYTFHPVGELPTGVAVSPDGTRAYVACSGSHELAVFDVGTIARPEGRLDPIDLGAHAPFDVAVSDDRVLVTVPDEGMLLSIDPATAEPTELLLTATPADGGGGGGGADAGAGDAGADDAGASDAGDGDAGAGGDDAGAGDGGAPPVEEGASRPWRMALDLEDARLYCANAGRAGVSVVDLDAFTELPALPIGTPTTSVAVSPRRLHGEAGRFLYGVERNEGGVRVVDLETGALVDANHGSYQRDGETVPYDDSRHPGPAIQVPGVARAVEIFARTSAGDPAPEVLDGMFAAILSSDGLLYLVDIEDDDAEARASGADEVGYVFLPHHLRSLRRFTAADLPQLAGNPSVQVSSTQVICGVDYGFVAHFDADGVAPPCDEAGQGIQIEQDYPWQSTNETWTVTYEGTIPGTVRPRGNLEGTNEVLDRSADFCALGVQPGDRFALVTPATKATPETECGREDGELSWPIAEVFRDHLVLAEPFGLDPAACGLDAWVDYRIRTDGVWTVVGTESGFLHDVVVDEDGRCVNAADADPRRIARAPECDPGDDDPACRFTNITMSFQMVRGVGDNGRPLATELDTSWTFTTTNALDPLAIAVGSLPSAVRYLPVRDSLFVVDPVDGGLVEVSVTSLARERSYR